MDILIDSFIQDIIKRVLHMNEFSSPNLFDMQFFISLAKVNKSIRNESIRSMLITPILPFHFDNRMEWTVQV